MTKMRIVKIVLATVSLVALISTGVLAGEVLTMILETRMPSTYDPAYVGGCPENWMFIYDTLIGNDESLVPVEPLLAKSWDISDDNLIITFHLRDDVKFHDRVPFTARDVKTTIEKQTSPKILEVDVTYVNPFTTLVGYEDYKNGKVDEIRGIKIIDDYTIEFRHERPNGTFLLGIGLTSIMPHHMIKDIAPDDMKGNDYFEHPIGTGPYELVEIREAEYYHFKANKDYWRGTPKISDIYLRKIDEVLAVTDGVADYVATRSLDVVKGARTAGYRVVNINSLRTQVFRVNTEKYPFNDINFRKALMYAMDRDQIIDIFYDGNAVKTTGMMGPGFWHNDFLAPYPYDPEMAKELIKASSYDGSEIELVFYYPDQLSKDMMVAIQYYWKEVGINVRVRFVDGATAGAIMFGVKDEELGIMYGAKAYADPSWLADFLSDSPMNYTRWRSSQFDEYIKKAIETVDPKERQKYIYLAQSLMYRDVIELPLFAPSIVNIISPRLKTTIKGVPGFYYAIDLRMHEWEIVD